MSTQPDKTLGQIAEWLSGKIKDAKSTLRSREQMEATWRSGDDKSWAAASALHPSTAKLKPMSKADRLREAASHGRIAVKCRHELEMFKAVAQIIDSVAQAQSVKSLEEIEDIARETAGAIVQSPPISEWVAYRAILRAILRACQAAVRANQ